ncbi:unnamed protein product, partial [Rotaria sp. Silwood2]
MDYVSKKQPAEPLITCIEAPRFLYGSLNEPYNIVQL